MLDKMEPPQISEGYGLSVTYACILDLVRSILLVIQGNSLVSNHEIHTEENAFIEHIFSHLILKL